MSGFPWIECMGVAVLLACSAFFSSAETSFFSLNPIQIRNLRRLRPVASGLVEEMLKAPTRLLSTILIGNTLVNVAAAGLGYVVFRHVTPAYAEVVSVAVMTLLLLIVGEVAPKRVAFMHAPTLAVLYAPVLRWLTRLLWPLRAMMEFVVSGFDGKLNPIGRVLTEDEILSAVEAGEEKGVIDEEERTMVDGILSMAETRASDVMTPRVDLTGIDLDLPAEKQERIARGVTFRYLPLYRDSLDHVEGFLDVLKYLLAEPRNLAAASLPVFHVPETAPLDSLLITFQQENRRVAIVADEFGGTAGLITRGDILEEILEDVENEHKEAPLSINLVGENRWLVDGAASLEDVNYELDLELEAEDVDRIAGWVMAQAGRIPRAGDTVEAQGCRVQVQRVRRQRIALVMLQKILASPPGEEGEA